MKPLAIAGLAAVGLLAFASSAGAATPTIPVSKGRDQIVQIAAAAGLPDFWRDWLIWVSKGEGGWSTGAHNDTPKETAASQKTLVRLIGEGRWPCPDAPSVYAIGSGGLYGQLGPLTTYFLNKHGLPALACGSPLIAWRNVPASTLAHLGQALGTANMIPEGHRTAIVLRAAYGNPSRLEDLATIDNPKRRAQYGATLESAGIPRSFLDAKIPAGSTGILESAIAKLRGLA